MVDAAPWGSNDEHQEGALMIVVELKLIRGGGASEMPHKQWLVTRQSR